MAGLIERYGDPGGVLARRGRQPGDAYGALVRAIVGQQLSAASARAIYGRLTGLFGERTPTPRELLATDVAALRGVGLSAAKVAFLRDLAEHVEDGELDLERLPELSDEEVFEQLVGRQGARPLDDRRVPALPSRPRRTCSRWATSGSSGRCRWSTASPSCPTPPSCAE